MPLKTASKEYLFF